MPEAQTIIILNEWPRWMKIKQAAIYSGIGRHRLIELAKAKKILGAKDPDSGRSDWIFKRDSIDRYRDNQMPRDENREKVLAYLERTA